MRSPPFFAMDKTSAIQVKCIDHVTLIVDDLEKSREFYVETLGMSKVERPGFSFPGLWFQAGSQQVHLILKHDVSGPVGDTSTGKSSRHHHFAFVVEDVHDAVSRFEQLQIPVVSGPQRRPDGYLQAFVCDPDGYVVEVCSPPT